MKEILKKKLNKKGFTLAELLIVVAIIAVLVAIAIPTFSAAANKANQGVAEANARSAYAEYMVELLSDGTATNNTFTYESAGTTTVCTVTANTDDGGYDVAVTMTKGGTGVTLSPSTFNFGKNTASNTAGG